MQFCVKKTSFVPVATWIGDERRTPQKIRKLGPRCLFKKEAVAPPKYWRRNMYLSFYYKHSFYLEFTCTVLSPSSPSLHVSPHLHFTLHLYLPPYLHLPCHLPQYLYIYISLPLYRSQNKSFKEGKRTEQFAASIAYCQTNRLLILLDGAVMEIRFVKENSKFKMKITLDRHGPTD